MIKGFDDFFFCTLVVVSYAACSIEDDGLARQGFSTSIQRNFRGTWSKCQNKIWWASDIWFCRVII